MTTEQLKKLFEPSGAASPSFAITHPFVATDEKGEIRGRFSNLRCAAKTAVRFGGWVNGPGQALDNVECRKVAG